MPSKRKILVVDDEKRNVKLLSAFLLADGFQPLEAFDGEQAIEITKRENPDVILLDIMMPNMSGFECTEQLKKDPKTRHIPIVLVTSLDGSDNRVKGLNAGADEFLTKPVNRTELLARVRALQRMKQMQEELQNRRTIVASISSNLVEEDVAKKKVLIVEDNQTLSKQIAKILEVANFEITVVSTMVIAREKISIEAPDIVLLDRLLPDGEGLTFLAELKSNYLYSDLPVIIITALDDLEQKIAGIECGADDYLIKPIEHNELLARVRAGIRRSVAIKHLKRDLVEAQKNTVTDPLTKVRNRFYLDADLEYRCAQAARNPERNFAIMMLDIDHFKSINDDFGHLVGDEVLCRVAQQLQKEARTADIVTRYGGEEFCIVLPEIEMNDALAIGERIREGIEAMVFSSCNNKSITVSIGIASFAGSNESAKSLIARADKALYSAKNTGRNKVCISL
jgi:two-component system, cell cycle response regulator